MVASHPDASSTCRPGEQSRLVESARDLDQIRYKKHENATRYGLLSTAQPVAGMVSGLLAGLITQHMEGAGGVRGWRWILVSAAAETGYLLIAIDSGRSSLDSSGSPCISFPAEFPINVQTLLERGRRRPGLHTTCTRRHRSSAT